MTTIRRFDELFRHPMEKATSSQRILCILRCCLSLLLLKAQEAGEQVSELQCPSSAWTPHQHWYQQQQLGPLRSDPGPYAYQWNPQDNHPCTVPRMGMKEYLARFGQGGLPWNHPDPLIVTAKVQAGTECEAKASSKAGRSRSRFQRNGWFQSITRLHHILKQFPPNFTVTLTSSNSSQHRRTVPFETYLREQLHGTDGRGETYPQQRANETWYLFGETYTEPWTRLLKSYDVPLCEACLPRSSVALSFGIGNRGSGVQWHVHGPGFSESIHGRKHWILSKDKPTFHPDQTSRNWMEFDYVRLAQESPTRLPLECTLEPGDFLYFPDGIWHATINLDPYTVFVSSFLSPRLRDETFD